MDAHGNTVLRVCQRRRARRLAYWNGAIWALGNGLADTMLVVYLALELHAPGIGLGVGLLLAMRHIAGLLRLAAPLVIGRLMGRKWFCMAGYLAAALTLALLPTAAAPGRMPGAGWSLGALVVLWCVYHLLQYLATVALWSWLADLVRLRVRGRFLGLRQRWMLLGQSAGMVTAGAFAWEFHRRFPGESAYLGYALPALAGAVFMLLAVIPLGFLPGATVSGVAARGARPRDYLRVLADLRFLRLLAFGCWFSFFNGITQSAQNIFHKEVLKLPVLWPLGLKTMLRGGQLAVSPALGRAADRHGNRKMMMPCVLLTASGLAFYLAAATFGWFWFAGAWVVWVAYAGINVGQPALLLKLSPRQTDTPYIAAYDAATGLCYALSTICGGWLMDRWLDIRLELPGGLSLDFYQLAFLAGWITRSLAAVVLWLVIEQAPAESAREEVP